MLTKVDSSLVPEFLTKNFFECFMENISNSTMYLHKVSRDIVFLSLFFLNQIYLIISNHNFFSFFSKAQLNCSCFRNSSKY